LGCWARHVRPAGNQESEAERTNGDHSMTESSAREHHLDDLSTPPASEQGAGERDGMTGSPVPRADLSDAVDRVSRHELERQVERLSAELMKLRRALAPLARFRTLIDQAGEAMFVIDTTTGRFVDINETALRWLGLPRNRLLTLTVRDVQVEFPLEYGGTPSEHVTDTRNLDRPWIHSEGVHRRRDGSCFPVDVAVAQRRFADRTFTLVVVRESKRRQQAEQALREAQESYHTLFDLSHDAVYVTTREGRIADANRAAIERFGYAKHELIGLEARALYSNPRDIRKFQDIVEENGFVRDFPIQFRARDGSVFLGLLTATLRHTGDGAIGGYQCLIRSDSDPSQAARRSGGASEIERAVCSKREPHAEPGTAADSVDAGAGSRDLTDDETALLEHLEPSDMEAGAGPSDAFEPDGVTCLPEQEEPPSSTIREDEASQAAPAPDEITSGLAANGAPFKAEESDLAAAVAPDDEHSTAERDGPTDDSAGAGSRREPQANVVLNRLAGSACGYEMHGSARPVPHAQRRSSRRHGEAGRVRHGQGRTAPWQHKPAPPSVVAERHAVSRWSLVTLGVVLSLVGWSDAVVVTFPYNMGVQEWQYAVRILAGALMALGIAGPRAAVATRAIAVVILGLALVMLVTYGGYLLDFPFGLEDVVPDAELDSARRRASEFTAVTVFGCVWIAGFLWRIGRGR